MQDVIVVRVKTKKEALKKIDVLKETNVDAQASYKQMLVFTTDVIYKIKVGE